MAIFDVPGMGHVEFPDDMSDDQVKAAIKRQLGRSQTPTPAAPTTAQDYYSQRMSPEDERNRGLAQRSVIQGAVGAGLGMAGLAGDALVNAAYGGMKLLSKTGAVEPPDPKNYYKGSGQTYQPVSEMIGRIGAAPANALNLPVPETGREKVATGALEGATSALTGVGTGRALLGAGIKGAETIGRTLSSTPIAQIVSGVLGGGVGAATENAPAAVGASLLPLLFSRGKSNRVHAGTPEGQELVARRILADEAGPDLPRAQQNIDEYLAGNRTANPGFQLSTPNASLSERLAVIDPKWREMAQPAPIYLKRNNDTILSEGLDRLGAVAGTSATARREAGNVAKADRAAMNLPSRANLDVLPLIQHIEEGSVLNSGRGVGDTERSVLQTIKETLQPRTRPVTETVQATDKKGNIKDVQRLIALEANPADLAESRRTIATNQWDQGKYATPDVQGARTAARPLLNALDEGLNEVTGGQWNQYMERQRTLRKEADAQGFMQDFAERTGVKDKQHPNKARYINEGQWLERMTAKNEDVRIKGANPGRGVSLSKLEEISPERGAFLRGATRDIQAGSWAETLPGAGSRGSNTSPKLNFDQLVNQKVLEHGGPAARSALVGAKLLNVGVGGTGKIMSALGGGALGGAVQALGRGSASLLTNVAENANARNIQAVRGIIGQAWEPAEFARLMRLQEPQPRTWSQTGARAASRTGRLGYQGLLGAGQRDESRYR